MTTLLARDEDVLVTMDSTRRELKNAGVYADAVRSLHMRCRMTASLRATATRARDPRRAGLTTCRWSRVRCARQAKAGPPLPALGFPGKPDNRGRFRLPVRTRMRPFPLGT